jgi:chromosome partitioning protein
VRAVFNPQLELAGFLFTMSDPTINTETSLRVLRQTYIGQALITIIPRNVDIREAHFNQKDIFTYNQHSKAANSYDKLITELFNV